MKTDIVLAGVGGQGVLSMAAIIAAAALREGLQVKQGEVHGMSQRGGAVQAGLRLGDAPIHSDVVPEGGAQLILSLEPVEALRYLAWLAPDGVVMTAAEPFENIPDYPPLEDIHARIRALNGGHLIEAARLAKQAGSPRATNIVMVGAAAPYLPIDAAHLEAEIRERFRSKGADVVEHCLRAFALGREAGACIEA
ncbi:MAG: indolepyruvate oxidoreductase subunit beta [Planctomycetes bacterium]|nr:indolepyruvate oxidoreductase subunit beta [Planctomycetota bacterium]